MYVSRQDSADSRTYKHSGVTKLSDVIKNHIRYVIFEENAVGVLPHWASCPTLL